jgi:hypothetical protein
MAPRETPRVLAYDYPLPLAERRGLMSKIEERLDKHDRQIAAIRDLVHAGMRLVVETRKDIRALAAAQKRTEESLQALINSLRRGGNGHVKRKVDLQ